MRPRTPALAAAPSATSSAPMPTPTGPTSRGRGAVPTARARRPLLGLWVGLTVSALIGCAPAATTFVDGDAPLPAHAASLALAGPAPVEVVAGTLRSTFGCEVRYEEHRPEGGPQGPLVVLAHGFLRDLGAMRGWAEHFASHGVRTAVVSLCNSTPFDGRHDRNAVDLRAVAARLQHEGHGVLYAGFSAGGLAALLAAAEDPRSVAYLGLDAVDSGGLAGRATGLAQPALFLTAEPGACNADGNMGATAAAISSARIVRIPNATHCDFENPFDPLCARLCGRVEPAAAAAAIRAAVRALATDFVRTHGGAR